MGLLTFCVADKDIQTAEAINCVGHQFLTEFLVPEIARDCHTNSALRLDEVDTSFASGSSVGK